MFTVCPKCGLTLAITARDLRAAQGHVRCGRCQNVFNALESLTDEHPLPPLQATSAAANAPRGLPEEAPTSQSDPDSTAELAVVNAADEAPPTEVELSVEQVAAMMAGESRASSEATPEDAEVLAPEEIEFEALPEHLPRDPRAPEAEITEAEVRTAAEEFDSPAAAELPAEPSAENEPDAELPEPTLEFDESSPRAARGWTVGVAALLLALAVQVVNHYRNSLATVPALAGPLGAVYGALGIDLTPDWDVHAYDARQLGATLSGTGRHDITVRASIGNLAQRAQPLPLLRVILQDRFGRPVAARDVEPKDYLRSLPSPALLAPGGRVDASATFISPGPQVVGFEIDACLRRDGTVVCAHGS